MPPDWQPVNRATRSEKVFLISRRPSVGLRLARSSIRQRRIVAAPAGHCSFRSGGIRYACDVVK
jgi:hypothetical protein